MIAPGAEIPRVDVLGVGISAVNLKTAVEAVSRWIQEDRRTYVCVTGVHGVMESQRDPTLLDIHNRSGLTTPDGMPMVWAGRWAGAKNMERVYGPQLMRQLLEKAEHEAWTNYFYGGAPGVATTLAQRLLSRYPNLRIVGTHAPPFQPLSEDEDAAEVAIINAASPDLLWVGVSTPKQERWMAAHLGSLNAKVMLGVGAAFDINAGLRRSAPALMQRMGLEWLYRLIREPRRLWYRYLRNNPAFLLAVTSRRPFMRGGEGVQQDPNPVDQRDCRDH